MESNTYVLEVSNLCYLRTLLIHGACSAILAVQRKAQQADSWLPATKHWQSAVMGQ